ncbi:MAG TPA: hypothetical protein QGH28_05840 [Chloroflexota bacterium]|nr:hypothetical protein [Chloroflexota bacterium]
MVAISSSVSSTTAAAAATLARAWSGGFMPGIAQLAAGWARTRASAMSTI